MKKKIIIIGGGISGFGVALEALRQGFETTILEKDRCLSATSYNSLRIIHGGFRYLQSFDLLRVWRSVVDQGWVQQTFNKFVEPLPCIMPLNRFGLKSKIPVAIAGRFYQGFLLAAKSALNAPSVIDKNKISKIFGDDFNLAPFGGLLWYDLKISDLNGFHRSIIESVQCDGINIKESVVVEGVDRIGEERFIVRLDNGHHLEANLIINCSGPWINNIKTPAGFSSVFPKWQKAFNVILSRQIHPTHALGISSPSGRLFFLVPRGIETAIGTWYENIDGVEVVPTIKGVEVERFLRELNLAMPGYNFKETEVVSTDVGQIPIGSEVINSHNGYAEVVSVKYTTFRSLGQKVLNCMK